MSFLLFEPLFQERVWGGRALGEWLRRELPGTNPIGESWEIVDRADEQSVVRDGPDAGRTLRELIETRTADIMGPRWDATRRFPILVKWLDCAERLSLQVHPPAPVAASLGGEPKTENWYVARAAPGAAVLAGLKPGVDATQFHAAVVNHTADQLVLRHPTQAGDSLFIESGTMHAIDAGNLILEIQQNSDTTFRVYDWGRMGLDGRPRQLHVEQSLACIEANTAPTPRLIRRDDPVDLLVDAREFRLRRVRLAQGASLEFLAGEQPRLLSVVEGLLTATDGRQLPRGTNTLLPFAGRFTFSAKVDSTVLVTENFTRS
jgi:mannose-6-phosphate isomerase